MTCKDCIHCDVCVKKEETVQVDERNWANYELLDAVKNYCKDFKNKADFVEVVRCGKCKYGGVSIFSKTIDGEEGTACYCNLKNRVTDVDYYCLSGKRN